MTTTERFDLDFNPSLDRVCVMPDLCLCDEPQDQMLYRLEFSKRPWTTNAERAGNHWERARLVKEWRNAFHLLAKEAKIPPMKWMAVTAEPFSDAKGRQQDVAACNPAVKAAIDGLVDAGILPDDSPQYLTSVTFLSPKKNKNALVLYLRGVTA
jgi:crossover junction endodeoxyribonuclease RusA